MATNLLLPGPLASSEKLYGKQEPSILRLPPRSGSLGGDSIDLATVAGLTQDPWQDLCLDAIFSVDENEQWVCTEFGILVSRQNGKGNILIPFELAHLFLWPKPNGEPKTILHSAHELKTAVEAFRKIKRIITASPLLMKELLGGERGIKDNNQTRGFELKNGNRLLFMARSRNAGVGFSVDVLVVDEAQETPQPAMDALLPTMASLSNTQVLFTGTVPDELNNSEYFEGLRDRGRSGSDPRTGWVEFNPKGSQDPDVAAMIDVNDPEAMRAGNPGLGYRPGLTREVIEDEVSRLGADSVKRLRYSIWPNRREEEAKKLSEFDLDVWNRVAGEYPVHGDGGVIAIALGRGGGHATISKAIRYDSDHITVEHHKTDRKVRWVAEEVKALKAELGNALVVVDPKNAAMILTDLDRHRVKYLRMDLDEIAAAHSIFVELSNDGMVLHRDQTEVARSFEFATTRSIGRAGYTWEPSDPTKPITQAQSVTWAVWGVIKSESSPKKRTAPPPRAGVLKRTTEERAEPDLRTTRF